MIGDTTHWDRDQDWWELFPIEALSERNSKEPFFVFTVWPITPSVYLPGLFDVFTSFLSFYSRIDAAETTHNIDARLHVSISINLSLLSLVH